MSRPDDSSIRVRKRCHRRPSLLPFLIALFVHMGLAEFRRFGEWGELEGEGAQTNDQGENHLFSLLPVQEIEMIRALDDKVEGLTPFGRDRDLAQVPRTQNVVDLLDPVRVGLAETQVGWGA